MQNEDDLRGLAKVMDFMRAISMFICGNQHLLVLLQSIVNWGINIGVLDKILLNFQRTQIINHILITKVFAVKFLALSCLGTKGVKEEKVTWTKIYVFLLLVYPVFPEWWLLYLPLPLSATLHFISCQWLADTYVYWSLGYGCLGYSKTI
jgi:hypothetical protein